MHAHELAFSHFFCPVVQGTCQPWARGTWTAFTLLGTAEARAHGTPWVGESTTSLMQRNSSSDLLQETEAKGKKRKEKKKEQLLKELKMPVLACSASFAFCYLLFTIPLPRPFLAYEEAIIPCEFPWAVFTYHLAPANILDITAKIFWPWLLCVCSHTLFSSQLSWSAEWLFLPSSSSIIDLQQNKKRSHRKLWDQISKPNHIKRAGSSEISLNSAPKGQPQLPQPGYSSPRQDRNRDGARTEPIHPAGEMQAWLHVTTTGEGSVHIRWAFVCTSSVEKILLFCPLLEQQHTQIAAALIWLHRRESKK